MRHFYYLLFCFLLSAVSLQAQVNNPPPSRITISGTIKDGKTGEELIGATVFVKDTVGIGAVTNGYGFFSLTIPSSKSELTVRYIGYDDYAIKLDSVKNQSINVSLSPASKVLKEVEIKATKADENITNAQMSAVKLDVKQLEKIPVLFGEKDLLKTIQLLPGIQPASEGNSGFYVRGSSNDQNLILLDEAPVYNASHLLGFFSVFNNDAIKDATVYKGNMPAEYGGRLASVLDIRMKDGNSKEYVIGGGIGLISSRLNIEGPIVRDKGSFIITARRTYADLFLKLSKNENLRKSILYFYDINAKANYRIGPRDRIFISGYFGQDKFGFQDRFSIVYGNATATARWNHIFSDKLFSNTSFVFNDFNYTIGINVASIDVKSVIRDFALKEDLDFFLNSKNKLKFGFLTTFHTIVPGQVISQDTTRIGNIFLTKNYGWENAVYAQHEVSLWNKVTINYGVRLSIFSQVGPSKYFRFAENGAIDTFQLKLGQFNKTYVNPEPRVSISYNFFKNMSFKAAYSRNAQNLHQLSATTTSFATDRWVMTSNNIKPQIADQVSAGYFVNFYKDMFELSVEGYYKWMQNQIDYKNGATLRANETVETELLYGVGRAYGAEFFFKKRTGKFTGWVSYTLSRSERKFPTVNNQTWFPSRYDRTHDLSVVLMYDITPRINVSATWIYYTGAAATFLTGKYFLGGQPVPAYGDRNQDRFPAYHRLDIGATFVLKKRKTWEHDVNISVYNVYARKNAYTIDFKIDSDNNTTYYEKSYLFRIVPSVTYNFKFSVQPPKKKAK
ncbi:MAG TPA: TonB-dependent receptor [Chitinophagales bacterium]|nr:TonB-dependent receptor [Chitinophagales bacterium]